MRRLSTVLLLLLGLNLSAHAQEKTVGGVVSDSGGQPLVGATITVVGDDRAGAFTDRNGTYSIRIPSKGAVLRVSFVGYKTQLINVAARQTSVNVTMEDDAIVLESTVVTAMNIRRDEKSLATAFQKVDTESMTEARDQNFLNMLAGKVAGLQVTSNGPGGSASVVIRGINSLTGNNEPLYVIDGVPIVNHVDTNELNIDYGNPASSINPDDIKELVVLKGANASALYGSQAANGAIIITTKKASTGKNFGVSYSTTLQFSTIAEYPIYQNVYGTGDGGMSLKNAAFNARERNDGLPWYPDVPYGMPILTTMNQRSWGLPMTGFDVIGRNGKPKTYSPSNSLLDLYRTATSWTNSVSIEKASEFVSVRFSYSNIQSNDVMMYQNKISRNSMNLQANFKPAKFLDIDLGVRYTREDVKNRNHRNASKSNPMYSAAWMPRDLSMGEMSPWKQADGKLIDGVNTGGFVNPMWVLNETSNQDKKDWLLADMSLNFKLYKELRLRLKGSIDYNAGQGNDFVNMYGPNELSKGDGEYTEFSERYNNTRFEAMLSYSKHWSSFNLSANVGASSENYLRKKQTARVEVLKIADMKSLSNTDEKHTVWPDYDAKKKQAVFGTLSLGFKDCIYLDLTGRNDWTSTLPANARSYFYYSTGVSFILTEAIRKIPKSVLSFAKFRFSYAQVGNDTGFDKLRDGLRYGNIFRDMAWFESEAKRKNPGLKPESTTSMEAGADLKFWNNRVGVDFTWYSSRTKNQILDARISYASGYREAVINSGEVKNWGTEISLNVIPVRTKGFEWEAQFNWAKNNSLVVDLTDGVDWIQMQQSEGIAQFKIVKGHSLGSLYAKMAELDDKGRTIVDDRGKPRYKADQFLCDISPDWMGGFRNTFRYKGISASVLFDFRKGGKLWSATAHQGTRDGQTLTSLGGRDEYLFSKMVLGENDTERKGFVETPWVNNPNATNNINSSDPGATMVTYPDSERPKGTQAPNSVYGEGYKLLSGQDSHAWVNPSDYWMNTDANARYYLYDTSFIKLREVSVGYEFPKKLLQKGTRGIIQGVKISFVGRNLAILYRNTPKGIDPEASSSLGVVRGFEKGFSLPTASYGFDVKLTF